MGPSPCTSPTSPHLSWCPQQQGPGLSLEFLSWALVSCPAVVLGESSHLIQGQEALCALLFGFNLCHVSPAVTPASVMNGRPKC